jgi:hypothetical protein
MELISTDIALLAKIQFYINELNDLNRIIEMRDIIIDLNKANTSLGYTTAEDSKEYNDQCAIDIEGNFIKLGATLDNLEKAIDEFDKSIKEYIRAEQISFAVLHPNVDPSESEDTHSNGIKSLIDLLGLYVDKYDDYNNYYAQYLNQKEQQK